MATTSQTHTSNGTTNTYAITFPYLSTSDISVTVDGAAKDNQEHFTVNSSNQVEFYSSHIPTSGAVIRIFRETDDSESKLVFSTGSSIKAADLNNAFKQSLYLNQEFAQLADDESPELSADLDLNGKFVKGVLKVQSNSSTQGQIRLYSQGNGETPYVAIKAPPDGSFTDNLVFRIPSSNATANGQVLSSDTDGVTSWVTRASLSDFSISTTTVSENGGSSLVYNNGTFTYTPPNLAPYLESVVEDTTPQLGGELDLNGNKVRGILGVKSNIQNANSELQLYNSSESAYVSLKAPSLTSNNTLTLPATNGSSGQVLETDGSGVLDWVTRASLSDLSVTGSAGLSYNGNGVFTYTAPSPPDLSNYLTDYTVIASDLNSISIHALSDVNTIGAEPNDVLKWNGQNWTAQHDNTVSAQDLNIISIDALQDVNTNYGSGPSDNDVLTWDDATSKWIPQAASGGGGGLTRAQATAISLIFS